MIVTASQDRYGNITLRPVSQRWIDRFVRAVVSNGGPNDEEVYLQGDAATEFIETNLPPRYRKDLRNGWTVRFMADPWEVGNWYGYDAKDVASPGQRTGDGCQAKGVRGSGRSRAEEPHEKGTS